jgi:hypothetical protein
MQKGVKASHWQRLEPLTLVPTMFFSFCKCNMCGQSSYKRFNLGGIDPINDLALMMTSFVKTIKII